ncbi:hypothetical protein GWI33_016731 [Rhynchophorus ferrugineus]|uniref:Uncharacterized protein n=1 Tax=Rhynchophorus ferrugineus TaxID=354439 RepID=A0A834I0G1_RHYFE|nr:hypothetical protein GWI33_016731 [Rhynchophorus ferrugineus]
MLCRRLTIQDLIIPRKPPNAGLARPSRRTTLLTEKKTMGYFEHVVSSQRTGPVSVRGIVRSYYQRLLRVVADCESFLEYLQVQIVFIVNSG